MRLVQQERVELTCRTTSSGPWVIFMRPRRYIDVVARGETLPAQNTLRREHWFRVGIGTGVIVAVLIALAIAGVSAPIAVGTGVVIFLLSVMATVPRAGSRSR